MARLPVTNLQQKPTADGAVLTWDASAPQQSGQPNDYVIIVGGVDIARTTALTYTVTGLTKNTPGGVEAEYDSTEDTITITPLGISPPPQPPGPVTLGTPVAGNGTGSVAITPPTTGGAATGYTAQISPAGGTVDVSGLTASATGLTNGDSYAFVIAADNAAGSGPAVTSASFTPQAASSGIPAYFPAGLTTEVFGDDFTGTAVDLTKWNPNSWWYAPGTSGSSGTQDKTAPSQIAVANSIMTMTAERVNDTTGAGSWLSGCMMTAPEGAKPGFDVAPTFGIEFRFQMPPNGQGFWPALWMVFDPQDGTNYIEYDLLEAVNNMALGYVTWHPNSSGSGNQSGSYALEPGWNTVGGYVTDNEIITYCNGKQITKFSVNNTERMFIIINFAVGGSWPRASNASTPSPAEFQVDYVKVYQ